MQNDYFEILQERLEKKSWVEDEGFFRLHLNLDFLTNVYKLKTTRDWKKGKNMRTIWQRVCAKTLFQDVNVQFL